MQVGSSLSLGPQPRLVPAMGPKTPFGQEPNLLVGRCCAAGVFSFAELLASLCVIAAPTPSRLQLHASDAFLNNAAGRSPGGSVWRAMIRARTAMAQCSYVAEVLWDVSKAYDRVNRRKLIHTAVGLNNPISILRLSMASYARKRYVCDGGA